MPKLPKCAQVMIFQKGIHGGWRKICHVAAGTGNPQRVGLCNLIILKTVSMIAVIQNLLNMLQIPRSLKAKNYIDQIG